MNNHYTPPFTITSKILTLVEEIGEQIGHLEITGNFDSKLQLRRKNLIRTVQGSLSIEGNVLDLEQVSAILDGKKVIGPRREIQEVKNAIGTYEKLGTFRISSKSDLCKAHAVMMSGLVDKAGKFRTGGVGIKQGKKIIHIAPPAENVNALLNDLLKWLSSTDIHPLISSSVFHYEFEFIHPFSDGNGRIGRFWQTLILSKWKPVFSWLPVESIVKKRQKEYYNVLRICDKAGNSTHFIELMLSIILETMRSGLYTDQVSDQVSDQVKNLLKQLQKGETEAAGLMKRLDLSHRPTFRKNYLHPALAAGFIEMTDPEKPRNPKQKYRITEKGKLICV